MKYLLVNWVNSTVCRPVTSKLGGVFEGCLQLISTPVQTDRAVIPLVLQVCLYPDFEFGGHLNGCNADECSASEGGVGGLQSFHAAAPLA